MSLISFESIGFVQENIGNQPPNTTTTVTDSEKWERFRDHFPKLSLIDFALKTVIAIFVEYPQTSDLLISKITREAKRILIHCHPVSIRPNDEKVFATHFISIGKSIKLPIEIIMGETVPVEKEFKVLEAKKEVIDDLELELCLFEETVYERHHISLHTYTNQDEIYGLNDLDNQTKKWIERYFFLKARLAFDRKEYIEVATIARRIFSAPLL